MRSGNVRVYAVAVAAGLGLLFATPLRALWLRDSAPWWTVFVLWAFAVVALWALARVPHKEPGP
jgi:hypothetical protein